MNKDLKEFLDVADRLWGDFLEELEKAWEEYKKKVK